jgi:hypothetical protein
MAVSVQRCFHCGWTVCDGLLLREQRVYEADFVLCLLLTDRRELSDLGSGWDPVRRCNGLVRLGLDIRTRRIRR